MAAIVKGDPTPILRSTFPTFNAETKVYSLQFEYVGTEVAIRGLEAQMKARGLSYRITHDGPIWTMLVDEPQQTIDETIDRWEVFTEASEKSLFELIGAVEEAEVYDAARADGDPTYRQAVEDAATAKSSTIGSGRPTAAAIVKHLKSNVTGWQLDFIGLRRTRRVEQSVAGSTYRLTLDTGLLVYSTAQLNLPAVVAFAVPPTPAAISDLSSWGWRKRSQRVEFVDQYVEQTVELLFAPWSTLAYGAASAGLVW